MTACERCGQCCVLKLLEKDGTFTYKLCKHLIKLKSGKTLCRIFRTRLKKYLGTDPAGRKHSCILRKHDRHDYFGCPLNTDKPILNLKKVINKWKTKK